MGETRASPARCTDAEEPSLLSFVFTTGVENHRFSGVLVMGNASLG
jgi:hypothetical protein